MSSWNNVNIFAHTVMWRNQPIITVKRRITMKMKKYLFGMSVLVVALGLLRTQVMPSQATSSSWTSDDKIVATYYFYWYDIYTGLHFVDPDGSDALTDHPPDSYLSNYSYTEVAWHRRELLDMMTAQIDIVLPVYWGSDAEAFWSIPGLQNLVSAVEDLIDEGYTPPKIGMFYDTSALQQQNGGVPPDLTTQAGKALFYGMMADFFDLVPQSLWAMIEGRPILFLYSTEFVGVYDQSTFDYVAQHFQDDFGTTPHIIREASWEGVNTQGAYQWGVALNGPIAMGRIGSVGPGFDDTAVYGRPAPRIRDRECGEFYNAGWEAMIDSGATLVAVETWNELHEATEIAASREYSTTYIALTAQNVARWKATDYSAVPLVWLDFGRDLYLRGLRPAFNFPNGAWLVTSLVGREAAYPDHATTPPSDYIYLDVNNAFINATPSEVWVTVEYYDGGTDQWWLEYDNVSDPYLNTAPVVLQNTGQWKRHTFHLPDAYFGGRQHHEADLRLVDGYDGQTNYFGRIWIAKSAPGNQAPDLVGLNDIRLVPGQVVEIPVLATDPDGNPILLALDEDITFATLTDNRDGTGTLRLAPMRTDVRRCPYRITVTATDTGSPVLADAVTLRVTVCYDFNGDGQVDVDDIMQVASRWRMTDEDPDWEARYDLDNDGIITIVDIMMVAAHWGESCP